MVEHCTTFRGYPTLSWFNTMSKCFIARTKAIALYHVLLQYSCYVVQYYCKVALYYTKTTSVTYIYDTIEPMEWTQRSIALLLEEYDIFVRLKNSPLHTSGELKRM